MFGSLTIPIQLEMLYAVQGNQEERSKKRKGNCFKVLVLN
jgi:hypothetical protein